MIALSVLGAHPLTAQEDPDGQALYCPGEGRQFVGPDGKFMRIDKDTFLSWPKARQDAYRRALDRHVMRLDASARAFSSAAAYVRSHYLEINRLREEALNKDVRLFPFRGGNIDLLRKPESEMSSPELRAYRQSLTVFEGSTMLRLAQSNFNADFCSKHKS